MASKETGRPPGQSEEKLRSNRTTGCWSSSSSGGGGGATAGSTKIKRRGRDNEGGTDWHKYYWEVGTTQLQGELREAEMVRATGHLLQGRRVLASHSESRRRGK